MVSGLLSEQINLRVSFNNLIIKIIGFFLLVSESNSLTLTMSLTITVIKTYTSETMDSRTVRDSAAPWCSYISTHACTPMHTYTVMHTYMHTCMHTHVRSNANLQCFCLREPRRYYSLNVSSQLLHHLHRTSQNPSRKRQGGFRSRWDFSRMARVSCTVLTESAPTSLCDGEKYILSMLGDPEYEK